MKPNPKKCMFGTEEGTFLGHVVNMKGIKACPEKAKAVINLQSPRMLKEAQSLNGKLASLNISMSKSAKKSLPFFKTPKRCMKKSDFQWTLEAEKAFQDMKQCIAELLMQMPVYFGCRALQTLEVNYNPMEILVLALVHATRRLRRYFQAHPVIVVTDQPIKQILSRPENTRRMLKWKFELKAFDITYRPRTSIHGQVLADFIAERPNKESPTTEIRTKEVTPEPWTLFMDGSSCLEGSRARLILTSPKGEEFTYALRFKFNASNNEAEYEALVAGLRITKQMGVESLIAKVESRLVANQINGSYEAKEQSMIQYLEKTSV
ncbi:reverse transcriptase domain-containing protein [Tanacetum coccineum]